MGDSTPVKSMRRHAGSKYILHFHARFWRSLVLQMDLQFAVDDTVPRLDFLCVCYRWSKRSPVPSSCCQCQDASSYISWFSIAQCDFAPFGVGPSQSVPGDTACRNFWRNSALVSQTVTTMAGKSYQRMSEREREKQQKEYNHYNFRVVFWSLCCLAVRSGTLAFFELLLFRKVCRNSSKENCKKNSLRLNRYVLISDCLWFRYWGNTNMTTARRTSSPTGGCLYIISHHTQLEFWTWTSQSEKDPSPLPGPGTPWSPTIMWCRWRDGWTWRLLYRLVCLDQFV